MAKYHYLPPQIVPVQTNATTASANIVKAITPDAAYEAKTAQVVLMRENGTLKMTPQGLKRLGKASVKFLRPEIPAGASRKVIENVEVFTMTEMSEDEERQLSSDLAEMLGGVAWP